MLSPCEKKQRKENTDPVNFLPLSGKEAGGIWFLLLEDTKISGHDLCA